MTVGNDARCSVILFLKMILIFDFNILISNKMI